MPRRWRNGGLALALLALAAVGAFSVNGHAPAQGSVNWNHSGQHAGNVNWNHSSDTGVNWR